MKLIINGKVKTIRELAEKLNMDRSFLARTLALANLAPNIVTMIWENKQPVSLNLDKLRKGIPENWNEQRELFCSN